MTEWGLLALALLLLAGNAVFVASETALVTVERAEVDGAVRRDEPQARLLAGALRQLSTHLSAAQLGITVTSLAIGLLAEPSLAQLLRGPLERVGLDPHVAEPVAIGVALLVASVVQMVLGELVPKNVALTRPLRTAYRVIRAQLAFAALTRPLVAVLNGAANRLLRMIGVEPAEELRSARTPEELARVLRQSAAQGELVPGAAALLVNALLFGDRRASDVLTPRVQVQFVEEDGAVASVLAAARASGHSRFPVVRKGSDEVTGMVHVKHAVAVAPEQRRHQRVREIMTPPVLVPSTVSVHDLLDTLRSRGMQMAVVVDEFGGTDGVVTLEDIVEELVGEVRDETDREGPEQRARQRPDGSWVLSGLLRPDEATELTGLRVPEGAYETLGGLLQHALGRVGSVGDRVRLPDGSTLCILRMQVRRIDSVRLVPPAPHESPAAQEDLP